MAESIYVKSKSLKVLLIVLLSFTVIFISLIAFSHMGRANQMNAARESIPAYIPEGLPNHYFSNNAFQDTINILSFKLDEKEQTDIMNEISTETFKWRKFSQSDVEALMKWLDFLDEKDLEKVSFTVGSYYCCFDYHNEEWAQMKDYSIFGSYRIITYTPETSYYNLFLM